MISIGRDFFRGDLGIKKAKTLKNKCKVPCGKRAHLNNCHKAHHLHSNHAKHASVPSACTAHVWANPAATATTGPRSAGRSHWPYELSPKHALHSMLRKPTQKTNCDLSCGRFCKFQFLPQPCLDPESQCEARRHCVVFRAPHDWILAHYCQRWRYCRGLVPCLFNCHKAHHLHSNHANFALTYFFGDVHE